jgi:superfamily II DNA/RNA helicase
MVQKLYPYLYVCPRVETHFLLPDRPSNMIAQSQSGTGKTAAFVLTMLSRVNPDENFPQVV